MDRLWLDVMLLMWLGHRRKWWVGWQCNPLQGLYVASAEAGDDPLPGEHGVEQHQGQGGGRSVDDAQPDDGPTTSKVSLAPSRKELQKRRQSAGNILQYSVQQLLKPINTRLWAGLAHLAVPVERWFSAAVGHVKTPCGVRNLFHDLCDGQLFVVCSELWQNFATPSFAERLGFHRFAEDQKTDHIRRQDRLVADCMFKLLVEFTGELLATATMFAPPPPPPGGSCHCATRAPRCGRRRCKTSGCLGRR